MVSAASPGSCGDGDGPREEPTMTEAGPSRYDRGAAKMREVYAA